MGPSSGNKGVGDARGRWIFPPFFPLASGFLMIMDWFIIISKLLRNHQLSLTAAQCPQAH